MMLLPYIFIAIVAGVLFLAARPGMLPSWIRPAAGIFVSTAPWTWKRTIITLSIVFSLPFGLVAVLLIQDRIEQNRPKHYERAADFSLDALPAGASDIRFMPAGTLGPLGRAYEFRCTESEYREWAKRIRKSHSELGEVREEEWGQHPEITRDGSVELAVVKHFLISDWRFQDQGFYLVYDRSKGRAIRWSHSR